MLGLHWAYAGPTLGLRGMSTIPATGSHLAEDGACGSGGRARLCLRPAQTEPGPAPTSTKPPLPPPPPHRGQAGTLADPSGIAEGQGCRGPNLRCWASRKTALQPGCLPWQPPRIYTWAAAHMTPN